MVTIKATFAFIDFSQVLLCTTFFFCKVYDISSQLCYMKTFLETQGIFLSNKADCSAGPSASHTATTKANSVCLYEMHGA